MTFDRAIAVTATIAVKTAECDGNEVARAGELLQHVIKSSSPDDAIAAELGDLGKAVDHNDLGEAANHDDLGEADDHDDLGEAAYHDDLGEADDHDDLGEAADHDAAIATKVTGPVSISGIWDKSSESGDDGRSSDEKSSRYPKISTVLLCKVSKPQDSRQLNDKDEWHKTLSCEVKKPHSSGSPCGNGIYEEICARDGSSENVGKGRGSLSSEGDSFSEHSIPDISSARAAEPSGSHISGDGEAAESALMAGCTEHPGFSTWQSEGNDGKPRDQDDQEDSSDGLEYETYFDDNADELEYESYFDGNVDELGSESYVDVGFEKLEDGCLADDSSNELGCESSVGGAASEQGDECLILDVGKEPEHETLADDRDAKPIQGLPMDDEHGQQKVKWHADNNVAVPALTGNNTHVMRDTWTCSQSVSPCLEGEQHLESARPCAEAPTLYCEAMDCKQHVGEKTKSNKLEYLPSVLESDPHLSSMVQPVIGIQPAACSVLDHVTLGSTDQSAVISIDASDRLDAKLLVGEVSLWESDTTAAEQISTTSLTGVITDFHEDKVTYSNKIVNVHDATQTFRTVVEPPFCKPNMLSAIAHSQRIEEQAQEISAGSLLTQEASQKIIAEPQQGSTALQEVIAELQDGMVAPRGVTAESQQGNAPLEEVTAESQQGSAALQDVVAKSQQGSTALLEVIAESQPGSTALLEVIAESQPGSTALLEVIAESQPGSTTLLEVIAESQPESTALLEVIAESQPESTTLLEVIAESQPGSTTSSEVITESQQSELAAQEVIVGPTESVATAQKRSAVTETLSTVSQQPVSQEAVMEYQQNEVAAPDAAAKSDEEKEKASPAHWNTYGSSMPPSLTSHSSSVSVRTGHENQGFDAETIDQVAVPTMVHEQPSVLFSNYDQRRDDDGLKEDTNVPEQTVPYVVPLYHAVPGAPSIDRFFDHALDGNLEEGARKRLDAITVYISEMMDITKREVTDLLSGKVVDRSARATEPHASSGHDLACSSSPWALLPSDGRGLSMANSAPDEACVDVCSKGVEQPVPALNPCQLHEEVRTIGSAANAGPEGRGSEPPQLGGTGPSATQPCRVSPGPVPAAVQQQRPAVQQRPAMTKKARLMSSRELVESRRNKLGQREVGMEDSGGAVTVAQTISGEPSPIVLTSTPSPDAPTGHVSSIDVAGGCSASSADSFTPEAATAQVIITATSKSLSAPCALTEKTASHQAAFPNSNCSDPHCVTQEACNNEEASDILLAKSAAFVNETNASNPCDTLVLSADTEQLLEQEASVSSTRRLTDSEMPLQLGPGIEASTDNARGPSVMAVIAGNCSASSQTWIQMIVTNGADDAEHSDMAWHATAAAMAVEQRAFNEADSSLSPPIKHAANAVSNDSNEVCIEVPEDRDTASSADVSPRVLHMSSHASHLSDDSLLYVFMGDTGSFDTVLGVPNLETCFKVDTPKTSSCECLTPDHETRDETHRYGRRLSEPMLRTPVRGSADTDLARIQMTMTLSALAAADAEYSLPGTADLAVAGDTLNDADDVLPQRSDDPDAGSQRPSSATAAQKPLSTPSAMHLQSGELINIGALSVLGDNQCMAMEPAVSNILDPVASLAPAVSSLGDFPVSREISHISVTPSSFPCVQATKSVDDSAAHEVQPIHGPPATMLTATTLTLPYYVPSVTMPGAVSATHLHSVNASLQTIYTIEDAVVTPLTALPEGIPVASTSSAAAITLSGLPHDAGTTAGVLKMIQPDTVISTTQPSICQSKEVQPLARLTESRTNEAMLDCLPAQAAVMSRPGKAVPVAITSEGRASALSAAVTVVPLVTVTCAAASQPTGTQHIDCVTVARPTVSLPHHGTALESPTASQLPLQMRPQVGNVSAMEASGHSAACAKEIPSSECWTKDAISKAQPWRASWQSSELAASAELVTSAHSSRSSSSVLPSTEQDIKELHSHTHTRQAHSSGSFGKSASLKQKQHQTSRGLEKTSSLHQEMHPNKGTSQNIEPETDERLSRAEASAAGDLSPAIRHGDQSAGIPEEAMLARYVTNTKHAELCAAALLEPGTDNGPKSDASFSTCRSRRASTKLLPPVLPLDNPNCAQEALATTVENKKAIEDSSASFTSSRNVQASLDSGVPLFGYSYASLQVCSDVYANTRESNGQRSMGTGDPEGKVTPASLVRNVYTSTADHDTYTTAALGDRKGKVGAILNDKRGSTKSRNEETVASTENERITEATLPVKPAGVSAHQSAVTPQIQQAAMATSHQRMPSRLLHQQSLLDSALAPQTPRDVMVCKTSADISVGQESVDLSTQRGLASQSVLERMGADTSVQQASADACRTPKPCSTSAHLQLLQSGNTRGTHCGSDPPLKPHCVTVETGARGHYHIEQKVVHLTNNPTSDTDGDVVVRSLNSNTNKLNIYSSDGDSGGRLSADRIISPQRLTFDMQTDTDDIDAGKISWKSSQEDESQAANYAARASHHGRDAALGRRLTFDMQTSTTTLPSGDDAFLRLSRTSLLQGVSCSSRPMSPATAATAAARPQELSSFATGHKATRCSSSLVMAQNEYASPFDPAVPCSITARSEKLAQGRPKAVKGRRHSGRRLSEGRLLQVLVEAMMKTKRQTRKTGMAPMPDDAAVSDGLSSTVDIKAADDTRASERNQGETIDVDEAAQAAGVRHLMSNTEAAAGNTGPSPDCMTSQSMSAVVAKDCSQQMLAAGSTRPEMGAHVVMDSHAEMDTHAEMGTQAETDTRAEAAAVALPTAHDLGTAEDRDVCHVHTALKQDVCIGNAGPTADANSEHSDAAWSTSQLSCADAKAAVHDSFSKRLDPEDLSPASLRGMPNTRDTNESVLPIGTVAERSSGDYQGRTGSKGFAERPSGLRRAQRRARVRLPSQQRLKVRSLKCTDVQRLATSSHPCNGALLTLSTDHVDNRAIADQEPRHPSALLRTTDEKVAPHVHLGCRDWSLEAEYKDHLSSKDEISAAAAELPSSAAVYNLMPIKHSTDAHIVRLDSRSVGVHRDSPADSSSAITYCTPNDVSHAAGDTRQGVLASKPQRAPSSFASSAALGSTASQLTSAEDSSPATPGAHRRASRTLSCASSTKDEAIETDGWAEEELERLRAERERVVQLLARSAAGGASGGGELPVRLWQELAEARLNYSLGQTDTLLQTFDSTPPTFTTSRSVVNEKMDRHRLAGTTALAVAAHDIKGGVLELERTKSQIDAEIHRLELESERSRAERAKARARLISARLRRQAEIEIFKLERERELQTSLTVVQRHRRSSSASSKSNDIGADDGSSPRSASSLTSPLTSSASAMALTPRSHMRHLADIRRSLVTESSSLTEHSASTRQAAAASELNGGTQYSAMTASRNHARDWLEPRVARATSASAGQPHGMDGDVQIRSLDRPSTADEAPMLSFDQSYALTPSDLASGTIGHEAPTSSSVLTSVCNQLLLSPLSPLANDLPRPVVPVVSHVRSANRLSSARALAGRAPEVVLSNPAAVALRRQHPDRRATAAALAGAALRTSEDIEREIDEKIENLRRSHDNNAAIRRQRDDSY